MDKKLFKEKVLNLLEQDVDGLTSENKIKYIKKLIREYELENERPSEAVDSKVSMKVGMFVQTTFKKIIRAKLLSDDKVRLLQDPRYCKVTFDINYPFLKKIVWDIPLLEQKKINGYIRYWADEEIINGERYLICSQWYERNKRKYLIWIEEIVPIKKRG
jgi:hypothetical protein